MLKNGWKKLMMMVMIPGFLLIVSCAQQAVAPVDGNGEPVKAETAGDTGAVKAETPDSGEAVTGTDLEDKKAMERERFVNQDVLFGYDSAALSAEAQALLTDKAAWMKKNPGVHVVVEGHCDSRGTTEYNLGLGERRAVSARNFLVTLGISASRLDTISYGEEKPVALGDTEAAYKKNRRVHVTLK